MLENMKGLNLVLNIEISVWDCAHIKSIPNIYIQADVYHIILVIDIYIHILNTLYVYCIVGKTYFIIET